MLSATDAGKSYHMDALGAYVNEAFNPTIRSNGTGWAQDYVLAAQGYVPGFSAGNLRDARRYADRYMINPGTGAYVPAFQDTINKNQKTILPKESIRSLFL